MSDESATDGAPPQPSEPAARRRFQVAGLLFVLTCVSTTWVGAAGESGGFLSGLSYSVPLMAILLTHELGHYIAARIHRVPASPPYFVPLPLPPFGTMGAVILMRERIGNRNALLDIGAAGPLAGLCVALPVLIYGITHSPVLPLPKTVYSMEGRSLLYVALLHWLKGPIPEGQDIMLSPIAFAGWAGLFVTMLNLLPAVQLDGGHVAYALLGPAYERVSRAFRHLLVPFGIGVSLVYGVPAFLAGRRGDSLVSEAMTGAQWLIWALVLGLMARGGREHPPTDPGTLSPGRRVLAAFTLFLFLLLFMPTGIRAIVPG